MKNGVFILFWIVAALSFVFEVFSRLCLKIREKKDLRVHPLVWILLLLTLAVPILQSRYLLRLKLYADYTGGMRVEVRVGEEEDPSAEFYMTAAELHGTRSACTAALILWMTAAAASFSFGISSYLNSLRFLTMHSEVCRDERINRIFDEARRKAGIRRPVSLRIMRADLRISPCTCGTVFPAVFIGRGYPDEYPDRWLELLFLHELTHVRSFDSVLKLVTLLVTSVHTALPAAGRICTAVREDTEYRCDAAVLKKMGDGARKDYITMIVDIAERNSRSEYRTDDLLSAVSASSEFLTKRYRNMLTPHAERRSGFRELIPLTAGAAAVNLALTAVLTITNPYNTGIDFVSPMVEEAVCAYFEVQDPHDVTQAHLAAVYSVEFCRSAEEEAKPDPAGEGRYAVRCILNEGLIPGEEQDILPKPEEGKTHRFPTKTVDTRDLLLFRDLRTLIFSDSLESSEAEVWENVPYAVIRRK